jgi:hypothetical protein
MAKWNKKTFYLWVCILINAAKQIELSKTAITKSEKAKKVML